MTSRIQNSRISRENKRFIWLWNKCCDGEVSRGELMAKMGTENWKHLNDRAARLRRATGYNGEVKYLVQNTHGTTDTHKQLRLAHDENLYCEMAHNNWSMFLGTIGVGARDLP